MQIPYIPNYNDLPSSGSTIYLDNPYEDGRIYGPVLEYALELIPVFAVFDYVVLLSNGKMHNWPLKHVHQHLVVDEAIDYLSFISLN